MAVDPFSLALLLGGGAYGLGKIADFIGLFHDYSLGKKRVKLGEKRLESENLAAKLANEENRRQAEQYMALFREAKSEARQSKAEDRQMQLLQVLLASTLAGRQQAGQAAIGAQRRMPPMALTTLLRGE